MCVVVAPSVIRQVKSKWVAVSYRNSPSIRPTSDSLRPIFLLRGLPDVLAGSGLAGTGHFVKSLPMSLLTFSGL